MRFFFFFNKVHTILWDRGLGDGLEDYHKPAHIIYALRIM